VTSDPCWHLLNELENSPTQHALARGYLFNLCDDFSETTEAVLQKSALDNSAALGNPGDGCRLMLKDLKSFGDDLGTLGEAIDLPLLPHIGTIYRRSAKRITWHTHQAHELIFVLDGAAAYEFRQHPTLEVLGAHFLVVPAGLVHRGVHDVRTPSTMCGLLFNSVGRHGPRNTPFVQEDVHWMQEHLRQLGPVVCPFNADLRAVLTRLLEAQRAYETHEHRCLLSANLRLWGCAAVLGALRALTSNQQPNLNKLVLAAQDYLREHMGDAVHMADLVRHIGLGRSRLFDLFKTVTGLTPNDYLLRLRVGRAKELITEPELSLTNIAMACGFSSSQYFSKVFRKYTGQTPLDYRREAQSHVRRRMAP